MDSSTIDLNPALQAELAKLQAAYLAKLAHTLDDIQRLGQSLNDPAACPDALDRLYRHLHALAGSGGSYGLHQLSRQARHLERRVQGWVEQKFTTPCPADQAELLRDLADLERAAHAVPTPPAVQQTDSPSTSPPPTDTENKRACVWLVMSAQATANAVAQQLELFNFAVQIYPTVDAVVQAVDQSMPDLILLDMTAPLPKDWLVLDTAARLHSGLRCLDPFQDAARRVVLHCPVLVISDSDAFADRMQASKAHVQGYFLKPLDIPALIARMTHLINQKSSPPPRVLIIDDDADLAERYRLVLDAAGMDVTVLSEVTQMMPTLERLRPELILMDLHMPDFTGPELAGVIRQHDQWASLPIVYLSAETDFDQRVSALNRGGDDYLIKPITDRELIMAVRVRVERARQIDTLISRDSLTGLLKHASIKEAVNQAVAQARRQHTPTTLAMLDIDHFKSVNDRYGHALGDVVIASVATLLRQRLRQSDLIGRYGGEEFAVVLPDCTATMAYKLLDDLREHFATLSFQHAQQTFHCTVSIGLATTSDHPQANGAALLTLADGALYQAKSSGRNQVQVAAQTVTDSSKWPGEGQGQGRSRAENTEKG